MKLKETVKQSTLANGLTVITDTMPEAKVLSARLYVLCGGHHDPADKMGLNHLAEHMIAHSIPSMNGDAFMQKSNDRGMLSHNLSNNAYYTFYHANGRTGDVMGYMDDIACGLQNFAYDQAGFDLEKERLAQEIRHLQNDNDLNRMSYKKESFFSDGLLVRPSFGTLDGLSNITLQDIRDFHEQSHVGRNMVFVTSGELTHEQVCDWAETQLGHLPAGQKWDVPTSPVKTKTVFHEREGTDSVDVEICFPLSRTWVQDRYLLITLPRLLNQQIREDIANKHGLYMLFLAYDWFSNDACALKLVTNCRTDQAATVIEDITCFLDKFVDNPDMEGLKCEASKGFKSISLDREFNGLNPETRLDMLWTAHYQFGNVHDDSDFMDGLKNPDFSAALDSLRRGLKSRPAVFYDGNINPSLPTAEMIQNRDFSRPVPQSVKKPFLHRLFNLP